MKKVIWTIVCILIAGGALAGVLLLRSHKTAQPGVTIGQNPKITVAIADTEATREQGLSGHAPLKQNEGMLFIFDTPGRPGFWMKDMLFPLDIIWISKDWTVIDISKNLSPDTYPASFAPKADAQYVLEVSAGYADAHHIEIGQLATFQK